MNYIIIEKILLEDLIDILLRSNYTVLIEKIGENKIKVFFQERNERNDE